MAKEVVKRARLFLGGLELTSGSNQVEFSAEADEVEVTNFGSEGWREILQGIRRTALSAQLFLENTEDPEKTLHAEIDGGAATPFSAVKASANPPAQGDVAYFQSATGLYLTRQVQVGQAWGGSVRLVGTAPAVRGRLLEYGEQTASGNSAVYNLGVAVGAAERLYYAVHVLSQSGTAPTLDLLLQSDDAVGFPSPTTRVTVPQFDNLDVPGWAYGSVAGPITDTYWRVARTIGGTGGPKFTYCVLFGIAPSS